MNDEQKKLAGEIADYCRNAATLNQCQDWKELEIWLMEATTEPWHEHENLRPLQETYGDDIDAVRSGLMIEYIAKNITRRYIALRNVLEYEKLESEKNDGAIDQQQFNLDSAELARMHARLYERLDL